MQSKGLKKPGDRGDKPVPTFPLDTALIELIFGFDHVIFNGSIIESNGEAILGQIPCAGSGGDAGMVVAAHEGEGGMGIGGT